MKARDIIPSWPRPRTTASADKWFWVPRWRLWSDEECENIRYHQQQAAMAKRFIENGKPLSMRRFRPEWDAENFALEFLPLKPWEPDEVYESDATRP